MNPTLPGPRVRLDILLHARGLADSRARGRALIMAGRVRVDGQTATKASTLVRDDAELAIDTPDHPYVGRGGVKLAHALDQFSVDVSNVVALDVGASTGGFTDALLQRGAATVVALDVGHGQLAWRLRRDPRVIVLERTHIAKVDAGIFPTDDGRFDLITVDVSFISIRYFIERLPRLLRKNGNLIALVKPQFEVGRTEVGRGGLVKIPLLQHRAVTDVAAAAAEGGLTQVAMEPSPITGADGNREFFLHLQHAAKA
ncbi:MAG: TlyA family rRNA (cytidine-2'-O)-methyltransferase [Acidobacteria bacterium]|nr:TlyA family rRNA (cytidine-2'-O)-methyltransferase [Acidobacteriota bacterium]